jgi:hypothetical protein
MADINHLITLGIGTPADISHFTLFGLSPSTPAVDQVINYAICGLCRSGATRSDYYRPSAQIRINGTSRSSKIDKRTFQIVDVLNASPNTCTFECFGFAPARGQEVVVTLGTLQNRIFAGHILTIEQMAPNLNQRVRYRVSCIDYTWLLETRRITGVRYINESPSTIIADLITRFAPSGFNVSNVEASLDPIDFTANHAETLMQAIGRLMKMSSKGSYVGGYCYVDYNKGLHAFVTPEADGNPRTIGAANFSYWNFNYTVDLSQTRTRTYVLGGTTQSTSTVPNTATAVPVEDTRFFSSTGGYALSYGNQLVYTATSPASGPGWITGVTSFAYAIPQGESVRVMAVRVNSAAATSMAVILGTGDGLVDHIVDDERLSDGGARDRGDADLGIFEEPSAAVTFESRDKFLRSGKTLTVSLTAPATISGTFIVQEVVITDLDLGNGTTFPKRQAHAATAYQDAFKWLQTTDQLGEG